MNENCAFGIGLFHFGYRKKVPYKFSTSDYVETLRKTLLSLPSLSELSITCHEEFSESHIVTEEVPENFDDGSYFPDIAGLKITFSIFIPFRIQTELFPSLRGGIQTSTETFRVSILDSFYGPSSFIECVGANENCRPSGAVRLLREYLRREFKKLSGPITFETMGPSPFHANFYLQPGEAEEFELILEEAEHRGYNDLIFKYSNKQVAEEVRDELFHRLADELGLFYEITRCNMRIMVAGQNLISDWQTLQSKLTPRPSLFNAPKNICIHREAQALVSNGYAFQAQYAIEMQQAKNDIETTYRKGVPTYLEKYIRNSFQQINKYPVESIISWGEHMVGASFKQAEIIAVVLSAIGGGIVGSLLTSLLGK